MLAVDLKKLHEAEESMCPRYPTSLQMLNMVYMKHRPREWCV